MSMKDWFNPDEIPFLARKQSQKQGSCQLDAKPELCCRHVSKAELIPCTTHLFLTDPRGDAVEILGFFPSGSE